jgi:mRNA interferase RelE/StbE
MLQYKIKNTKTAEKQLQKLPKDIQIRILNRYKTLCLNPRGQDTKKMVGWDYNQYRARVGDYRIIYTIEDDIILITVIKVGHRKNVYN